MSESHIADPNPVVPILRRIAERGKEHIAKPIVPRGALQFLVGPILAQLAKIYGKDSHHLAHFPMLPLSLTDAQAKLELARRLNILERLIDLLEKAPPMAAANSQRDRIFVGHGHSSLWRELKDFLSERLRLPWDEFNREAVAGITTTDRLETMLNRATFAFLVLTAEEERIDSTMHPRTNVIHEVGLFQGVLGLRRAIVLIEDGCSSFSKIAGLSTIRFPRGDISARFEQIRGVLEREGLIGAFPG